MPYLRKKVGGRMKDTILYISDKEEDVISFLKYLQKKLQENKKECFLDEKYNVLKTQNYDIVGKNIFGNRIGVGYGNCLYYCFSENLEKVKIIDIGINALKEIFIHVREGAEEVSEFEILYMLGLVIDGSKKGLWREITRVRHIPESGGPDTVECAAIDDFPENFQTRDRDPLSICKTNPDCKRNPEKCEYSIRNIIDGGMMEEVEYFCGIEPCHNMWKKRNK